MWQEQLKLLRNRGSTKAVAYWLIKKAFRIDFFFFYVFDLTQPEQTRSVSSQQYHSFPFVTLSTPEEIQAANPKLIDTLGLQCGQDIDKLINDHTIIYALTDNQDVVTQVNIQRKTIMQVDTPSLLNFQLTPQDTFLGYLYTYSQYRGQGTAPILLHKVCNDLREKGYSRIITHIRATNTPSLNTFEKCGWSRSGWIISTIKGRILKKYLPKKLGIKISAISPNT